MGKTNENRKSYAEEGLEDIQSESAAAEGAVGYTEASGDEEGEFVQVGGLEPIKFFYRMNAPKKPSKHAYKILEKGATVTGTYERTFNNGKYKNNTFVIRNNEGELVGLPGTGSLTRSMDKLAIGSKVKITYNGVETIKSGEWAGNDAHAFTVLGNKLKA